MEENRPKRTKLLTIFLWLLLLMTVVALVGGLQAYQEMRGSPWQYVVANLLGRIIALPLIVVAIVAAVSAFQKGKRQNSN